MMTVFTLSNSASQLRFDQVDLKDEVVDWVQSTGSISVGSIKVALGGSLVSDLVAVTTEHSDSTLNRRLQTLVEHREDWADEEEGEVPTTGRAIDVGQQIVDAFQGASESPGVAIFPTAAGGLRFQRVDGVEMRAVEVGPVEGLELLRSVGPSFEEEAWEIQTVALAAGFLQERIPGIEY